MNEVAYSTVSGHIENGWRMLVRKDGELKAMIEIYGATISPEDNARIVGELIRALEAPMSETQKAEKIRHPTV